MLRPWVWIAAGFTVGVFVGIHSRPEWLPLAFLVVFAAAVAFWKLRTIRHAAAVAMVILFTGAGALYGQARHRTEGIDSLASRLTDASPETVMLLEGEVERADIWLPDSEYLQLVLRVDTAEIVGERRALNGTMLVGWYDPTGPVHPGERVRVRGRPALRLGSVNPGVRGVEDYYRARGIHSRMNIQSNALEMRGVASRWRPSHWSSKLRAALAQRLSVAAPESARGFLLTVWLGDRRRLDSELYSRFIVSGTAHVLAVSGLHVGIVFFSAMGLFRPMIRSRRFRLAVGLVAVWVFVLLAGARLSSVRAAVMLSLYFASELANREPDAPTSLGLVLFGFLLWEPDLVADTGFQLSFLSVASLLAFVEPIRDRLHFIPRFIREPLSATLAVQILPLPVVASAFHVLPLLSIPLNLLVVPLLGAVLGVTFLASVTVWILPPAATLLLHAADAIIALLLKLVEWTASWDGTYLRVTSPAMWALLAYAVVALVLYQGLRSRISFRPAASICGAGIIAVVFLWRAGSPSSEITILDVGHGDSVFLRSSQGATVLVDAGSRGDYWDRGRDTVAPFLWANHVERLDWLIISHADRDHIGGAHFLVETFPIGAVGIAELTERTPEEAVFLERCRERNIPIRFLTAGDTVSIDGIELEVLHPPERLPESMSRNDASLVMRAAIDGTEILLTGDIELAAELMLLDVDVSADILKVAHHGSRTSSSQRFIDHAHPRFAVISSGPRSGSSTVHPEVVERYSDTGIPVLRTDIHGGVRIRPGDAVSPPRGEREQRGYPTASAP